MATHKSAMKAHRRSEKNKARNTGILSRIKTFIKKVESFVTEGNEEEARKALRKAESEIMKGVSKKAVKKNTASRKVSRLSKKVKATSKTAAKKPAAKKPAAKKAAPAKKATAAKKPAAKKPAAKKTTKK